MGLFEYNCLSLSSLWPHDLSQSCAFHVTHGFSLFLFLSVHQSACLSVCLFSALGRPSCGCQIISLRFTLEISTELLGLFSTLEE